jgi:hypothetical protein
MAAWSFEHVPVQPSSTKVLVKTSTLLKLATNLNAPSEGDVLTLRIHKPSAYRLFTERAKHLAILVVRLPVLPHLDVLFVQQASAGRARAECRALATKSRHHSGQILSVFARHCALFGTEVEDRDVNIRCDYASDINRDNNAT